MKERSILFSTAMMRAIIDGTKTQTRRIVQPGPKQQWLSLDTLNSSPRAKPCIIRGEQWAQFAHPLAGKVVNGIQHDEWSPLTCIRSPYGQPGDRLWARGASRIDLEVTGLRVERLQDCSPRDALAEGLHSYEHFWRDCEYPLPDVAYEPVKGWPTRYSCPVQAYKALWESISGPGSWAANPWVWVIEFKMIGR